MNSLVCPILGLVLSGALACSGRGGAPAKPAFSVLIRASSDDEQPVANVAVLVGGRPLGATTAAGTLAATVSGDEGQTLPVYATCPERYSPPSSLPPLRLTQARALASGRAEPIAYDVVCDRKTRSVVVAVKASGLEDAPVLINGERQAVTDDDGIAHVAFTVDRDAPSVRVDLDISAVPTLAPRTPVAPSRSTERTRSSSSTSSSLVAHVPRARPGHQLPLATFRNGSIDAPDAIFPQIWPC